MPIGQEVNRSLCDADMALDADDHDLVRAVLRFEMLLDLRNPHGKCGFVSILDRVFEGDLGTGVAQFTAELSSGIYWDVQDLALNWSGDPKVRSIVSCAYWLLSSFELWQFYIILARCTDDVDQNIHGRILPYCRSKLILEIADTIIHEILELRKGFPFNFFPFHDRYSPSSRLTIMLA